MIGIRARHFALLAFLLSACAGEGDPSANSSGHGGFGSSQSALSPVTVDACADPGNLNFGTCARESVPTETVWPSLFQVIGLNPDEGAGVQQVNELAFKIRTVRFGRPGSLTMYMRRLQALTDAANHDIVFDLVGLTDGAIPIPRSKPPPTCGYGILDNQLARARYNLALIPFSSATPEDKKMVMNFTSSSSISLNPNTTYGIYVHLESPAKDRLGVAGMEADVYGSNIGLQPYTRQARVIGAACLTNPQWAAVANRDVFFMLNVNDGCTAGDSAPACGQGICFTNKSPQCDTYGNFLACAVSYCDVENDERCLPSTGLTGVAESANEYGCDVAKKTCYRRIPVAHSCNSDVECRPQVPAGDAISNLDYKCNLTTHTCNAPLNDARECLVADDPICVPPGASDPSKYACDVTTNRCYTLFGAIKESCNGLDDDCDGLTDESLASITCGLGQCQRQEYSCRADGRPFSCPNPDPRTNRSVEKCDNVDNDCDGVTDNMTTLSCGVGECFVSGVPACTADHNDNVCSQFQPPPSGEFCDGKDQDCDGYIDNAAPNNPAKLTRPYYPYASNTADKGICKTGAQTCNGANGTAAWLITTDPVGPQASDTCNGLDEDCDGNVDNAVPGDPTRIVRSYYDGPAGTRGKGVCRDGVETCGGFPYQDGFWWKSTLSVGPTGSETCNGLDDDCNGSVDDGLGSISCGQGVCQVAIYSCTGGLPAQCGVSGADPQTLGDQTKRVMAGEGSTLCNGLDDDCDGYFDNFPGTRANSNLTRSCFTGASSAYTTNGDGTRTYKGICQGGTEQCNTGGYWPTDGKSGVASPSPSSCIGQVLPAAAETCNGLDDNCNGTADEGADNVICPTSTTNATGMKCGTFNSVKQCVVSTCANFWYDVDGDPSNGCEVRDDANALASPSNTSTNQCLTGVNMGTLSVAATTSGSTSSLTNQTGVIPSSALFDYFSFTIAPPANLTEAGQKISVKVRDTLGGGTSNFKLYIFTSSCGGDLNYCNASFTNLDTWEFWDANCTGAGVGSGACTTRVRTYPVTVQVKVARTGGGTLSGIGYTLSVNRTAP